MQPQTGTRAASTPDTTYARIAGVLYLIIAVLGGFSIGYVPSVIVVAGDALATATSLANHQLLFSLGVLADVLVMAVEIVLTVMLFVLFRPVSLTLSLIAMVARLTMVMVMAVNALIYVTPLVLFALPVPGVEPEQAQRTILMLFEVHQVGIYVWDIFFGVHLAALGTLIVRSGYLPPLLGAAVLIGSPGYFLTGLLHVTFIDNAALNTVVVVFLVVASLSELAFALWLLVMGLGVAAYEDRKRRPAA